MPRLGTSGSAMRAVKINSCSSGGERVFRNCLSPMVSESATFSGRSGDAICATTSDNSTASGDSASSDGSIWSLPGTIARFRKAIRPSSGLWESVTSNNFRTNYQLYQAVCLEPPLPSRLVAYRWERASRFVSDSPDLSTLGASQMLSFSHLLPGSLIPKHSAAAPDMLTTNN